MKRKLGALSLAAIIGAGCLNRDLTSVQRDKVPAMGASAAEAMIPANRAAGVAALSPAEAPAAEPPAQPSNDRKLIRNGAMTLEVKSVAAALTSLAQMVREIGGQSTDQVDRQNQYGVRTASITWLVPAERLDAAIEAARALGEAKELSLNTEDVTAGYSDVTVRIATQKQLERQLVSLLARSSNRLSDLLEIEREAARVREEIDRLEGRIRSWDSQIAMSSIVITLTEPSPIAARTGGPLKTLLNSFGVAGENFVQTVAGLIAVSGAALPVMLLLAGPVWLLVRASRRNRAALPLDPAADRH